MEIWKCRIVTCANLLGQTIGCEIAIGLYVTSNKRMSGKQFDSRRPYHGVGGNL